MSKFHDDDTHATNPGALSLSERKLKELEPELFTDRTFKCSPGCPIDHPAAEMRERFAEHLQLGDSRAAVVVAVDPLVVAAFSSDLDAVVLLRFPAELVERYRLAVGSRLLTVNTYGDVRGKDTNEVFYAVDLVPGPRRSGWSNFSPFIADFLSDEAERIEAQKRALPESEWADVERLARVRIERMGLDTARPGQPTLAGVPVRRRGGQAYHQPIAYFAGTGVPGAAGANAASGVKAKKSEKAQIVFWLVVTIAAAVAVKFLR
jgi:hypothetical protein